MENKKFKELSILIDDSTQSEHFQKLNQTVQCKRSSETDDDNNDLVKGNGSGSETSSLLQDRPSRIDSSCEDCKNSTSVSCDSVYDFFGNTSSSASSSSKRSSSSNQSFVEERNRTNSSQHVDDNEENDSLKLVNYFTFLDDYIRFDVSRTGVSCFSGYSVSIQYEDDFLVGGNVGKLCCNLICGTNSRIQLWHKKKKAFALEYLPRDSCSRPKDCVYRVRMSNQQQHPNEIGTIHFQGDLVRVYNSYEKCLSFRRKQETNSYLVKAETGERQATIELFRGFRGEIIYYGLNILGDISSANKALLIALTLTMDIRQRESDMRCTFMWVPLFCILVIGFFTVLPWMYFSESS